MTGSTPRAPAIGLEPVIDVRSHVITDRPLLAADPTLAPWPSPSELAVAQTGAWLMPDRRPLSDEVEAFLDAGEPPILFGFGSMRAPRASGSTVLAAARALGYRAIVLRGWAELAPADDSPDWLSVGETNLQALLPRVAAIVHHGGSGTTTQAMRAGTPQVVVPHDYDQPYHANASPRSASGPRTPSRNPTADSLAEALDRILTPPVRARARIAGKRRAHGRYRGRAREILGG